MYTFFNGSECECERSSSAGLLAHCSAPALEHALRSVQHSSTLPLKTVSKFGWGNLGTYNDLSIIFHRDTSKRSTKSISSNSRPLKWRIFETKVRGGGGDHPPCPPAIGQMNLH